MRWLDVEFITIELFGGPADGTEVTVPLPLPSEYVVLVFPTRLLLFDPSAMAVIEQHIYLPCQYKGNRFEYAGTRAEKKTDA